MSKSKFAVLALITLFLLSFSLSAVLVVAQVSTYSTSKTVDVAVGSDGVFAVSEPDLGVSFQIEGSPGATGTVTTDVYLGNPQPTASVPSGISLTNFIAITINMNVHDFVQATITLNYTSGEVKNLQPPYAVYKYVTASNSYVALPSTMLASAKTITATLNTLNDLLLAIGGAEGASVAVPASIWIIIVVVVAIVVSVNVFIFYNLRRKQESIEKQSSLETNATT
ncbi:MAG: hypothetical protein ABSF65_04535 [Candidatus Bathyarchaeia archaeon]|jgi:flagellar basal body-associated protein FliL